MGWKIPSCDCAHLKYSEGRCRTRVVFNVDAVDHLEGLPQCLILFVGLDESFPFVCTGDANKNKQVVFDVVFVLAAGW